MPNNLFNWPKVMHTYAEQTKPSRDGREYVTCDREPVPILRASIDTLYIVKTSLFTFGKFVYIRKFYIFFPMMTSIKNSICAFLARVKTYTHTKVKHVHLLVLI